MSAPSPKVGQKIELNDGRSALVRFVGPTSFQTGEWIGVELEKETGKNDGSVAGVRYFECDQGYGMFLRPAGVRQVLEDVKPKPRGAAAASSAAAAKGRTGGVANGLKRQSLADMPGRRVSVATGSPTPGARASGIRSPTKSPTKQLGSNGVSSAAGSRTSTPPVARRPTAPTGTAASRARQSMPPSAATAGRRTSIVPSAPTAQRSGRTSLAPAAAARQSFTKPPAGRASMGRPPPAVRPDARQRTSTTTEESTEDDTSGRPSLASSRDEEESNQAETDEDDTITANFAPPPIPLEPSPAIRSRRPSSPAAASTHSARTMRSTAASNRQIEELDAKVKLLERKRAEDRDLRNNMEKAQQERDQYKNIIEKLQSKYKPQQQELTDLRQALSDSEKKFAEIEAIQAEHEAAMEMATLDREMAEETAEGLNTELEGLRAHYEEVQLELEILKEENVELSKEMSPEERSSAGFVQLMHSNERLRNALLALRDRSMDEKEDLKQQIESMEDQVKELDALRYQHDEAREKLLRSEADTSDLRQQLEVALQAEEMIEELTERNGRLESTVDDLKAAIEDLEDLKELNDELEINHVEAEKQMQEEIDFKDSLILDRERTTKLQQETLDDRDNTINQFRAMVRGLQSDMADMKASKQLSDTEAKELEGKSRAMMDLNMKLQNSAAKTQVKTLDLELRKLDAQEASEHLAIVQLFLPEAFHGERDSVLALLRFKRIAFKANLIHGFVEERVASHGTRGIDQDVFAACDVVDKLTWVSGMADRFVNSICACSILDFANYESALYELEPVERALNSYIDGLRRDELKERDVANELQRSIAVMTHLASLHIQDDLSSHADDLLMRSQCLQSQLESVATALQLSRTMVETHVSQASEEDEEDEEESASDLAIILNRAEALVSHARSAKVMAGKTHRSLSDLQARSLTLEGECTSSFENTESLAAAVTLYTREAGDALRTLFDEEGRNEPFTAAEVASTLSRTATSIFSLNNPEAGPFSALASRLRDLTTALIDLAALPTDLDNTVEFDRAPAPWVARAHELKQKKLTNIDTEAELHRTLEALRARDGAVKEKETELEEQSVRIEMLEARMRDASKRSARIAELESQLHDAREAATRAQREVETARADKEREAARVREEMGRLGDAARRGRTRNGDGGDERDSDTGLGPDTRFFTLRKQEFQIASLESAVRFLSEENLRLRVPAPDAPVVQHERALGWLDEPLQRPRTEAWVRKRNLAHEGRDVLGRMLDLATGKGAAVVDLGLVKGGNRDPLKWRPAREGPRWKVERRREEWEGLRGWGGRLVEEGGVRS